MSGQRRKSFIKTTEKAATTCEIIALAFANITTLLIDEMVNMEMSLQFIK